MIGARIRSLRQARSLTQTELAARLGIAAATVVKWEAGQVEPRLRQLRSLAEVFGVTIDDLAWGEDGEAQTSGAVDVGSLVALHEAAVATAAEGGPGSRRFAAALKSVVEADRRTIEGLDAVERFSGKG